jgi:hypothetical protein
MAFVTNFQDAKTEDHRYIYKVNVILLKKQASPKKVG